MVFKKYKKAKSLVRSAKAVTRERVLNYCFYLLARQDYTEKKIRQKIKQIYPDGEKFTDDIIVFLKDKGYLDDVRYLERCLEVMVDDLQMTAKQIKQKLAAKGFDLALIDDKLSEQIFSEEEQYQQALFLKEKWYGKTKINDPKTKQRLFSRLSYRGYDFSIINKVIRHE